MRGAAALKRMQRVAAWMTPMLLCVLAGVYVLVSDRTPWGEWLTIWPPIGWGVLFFVRALVLWLEGLRRLSMLTVALSLLFVAVNTEVAAIFRRPEPSIAVRFEELRVGTLPAPRQQALRIVSWNVAGGAPLTELEELDPDICILQEIGGVAAAVKASAHWKDFSGSPRSIPARSPVTRRPSPRAPRSAHGPRRCCSWSRFRVASACWWLTSG